MRNVRPIGGFHITPWCFYYLSLSDKEKVKGIDNLWALSIDAKPLNATFM